MGTRVKVVINIVAIAAFIGAAAYIYNGIDELTETFIGQRKSDAQFFAQLIRDNWDGIQSIPDEKKKILVANLDPAIAGADLRFFRTLLMVSYLLLCGAAILDRLVALFKLWQASLVPDNAP